MDATSLNSKANAVWLQLIRAAGEPLVAIEIAERAGIANERSRERKRRAVRAEIKTLREAGHRICAGNNCEGDDGAGYWIAQSDTEWTEYCEARKAGRVLDFVRIKQMRTAARERVTKQGTLFAV